MERQTPTLITDQLVINTRNELEAYAAQCPGGKVHLARLFDVELSSTQVRSLLEKGGRVSGLLNPGVINYIEEYSLYGCWPPEQ